MIFVTSCSFPSASVFWPCAGILTCPVRKYLFLFYDYQLLDEGKCRFFVAILERDRAEYVFEVLAVLELFLEGLDTFV